MTTKPRPRGRRERLLGLHRIAAAIVGIYVMAHLANHLAALRGIDAHLAFMQGVRRISRIPVIEALMLAGVAVQMGSGGWLALRRAPPLGARRLPFDRLQTWSGAYLALFMLVHVVSVLLGRARLGLDTNFRFAAAGLNTGAWPLFFVPYYGLAVAALFAHLACALRRRLPGRVALAARKRVAFTVIALGVVTAALIVAAFSGAFYPVDLPDAYRATFT